MLGFAAGIFCPIFDYATGLNAVSVRNSCRKFTLILRTSKRNIQLVHNWRYQKPRSFTVAFQNFLTGWPGSFRYILGDSYILLFMDLFEISC